MRSKAFPIVSEHKNLREMKGKKDCGRNDEGQSSPCTAFTNSTEEDKFSVVHRWGNAEGSLEGTWGQNLDKQGSDKTAACNIHPTRNKQPGGQLKICSQHILSINVLQIFYSKSLFICQLMTPIKKDPLKVSESGCRRFQKTSCTKLWNLIKLQV